MFYYAIDYLHEIEGEVEIILNRKYFNTVPRELARFSVKIMGKLEFFLYSILNRHESWITPTAHPLPWLTHQLVVIHDVYPFIGKIGLVKIELLKLSYFFNNYSVGIINKALLIPFVIKIKKDNQWLYLPNKIPISKSINQQPKSRDITKIGLIGSDSTKKNYSDLISRLKLNYQYKIFGQDTNYFRSLKNEFPAHDIDLVDSSDVTFEDFAIDIDCVISVSKEEGFGRLNIAAIQNGIPVILLRSVTATEFYQKLHDIRSGITISNTVDEISQILENKFMRNFTLDLNSLYDLQQHFISGSQLLNLWIKQK